MMISMTSGALRLSLSVVLYNFNRTLTNAVQFCLWQHIRRLPVHSGKQPFDMIGSYIYDKTQQAISVSSERCCIMQSRFMASRDKCGQRAQAAAKKKSINFSYCKS